MTAETLALIAGYFLCSEAAERRLLSPSEVETCVQLYTEVKLSFVEGVDLEAFLNLPARARAEVNQLGYTSYTAWREGNGGLVEQMKTEAKERLSTLDGS